MPVPATLDRPGIAARIPHQGAMCLLEALVAWDEARIDCRSTTHADPANPLRTDGALLAPCAIEYAAQAMALHGALLAPAGAASRPGVLASVRGVRLAAARLDDAPAPLAVRAERLAGDERQCQYRFEVADATGRVLAEGRATVLFGTLT